jgi:predicted MFS family arabinose efflux permease
MTTTTRPSILSRALVLRLVSVVASSIGFYLPLAVIPMFTAAAGSRSAAGLANGALLVASVIGELATPRVVARIGYRGALGAGLALLGAPTLVLLAPSSVPVIVAVSAARGAGFGMLCVAGGALTAALIPDERRGEGLAVVGIVGGIPALLALPFGTWAARHWGFGIVFMLTAAAPLAAIATVPGLPRRDASTRGRHGVLAGSRTGALIRPATIFAASASAAGVVVTYLPLTVTGRTAWVATAGLFLQPAASTAGRWVAGRVGDRRSQTGLLLPGVALSIMGMTAMAATSSAPLVTAGAATFGAGFGILQNATLSLMYARVSKARYGTVSAVWNASYDIGMAAGAIGAGLLVTVTGYTPTFLITAATMLPALAMARREAAPELDPSSTAAPALGTEPAPA